MPTTDRRPDPADPKFVDDLIVIESMYQAARSLYERISKDTGWDSHPNRDAMLEEIVTQGRLLRKVCDQAINEWFAGG